MNTFAYVFPGQGSQYVGMGKSFYESNAAAKATFDEASAALGYDISRVVFEGPAEDLNRTDITQPALLTTSIAAYRVLKESLDISPAYLAGHSLGEYTALVASGALDFSAAVSLVAKRGRLMMEAGGAGGMCAIIGLYSKDVAALCEEISTESAVVVPANINSPLQVVISGEAGAVQRAAAEAKARGAKMVIPLKVSVPSHSPLMSGAAEKFAVELKNITLGKLAIPVISNVEAEPYSSMAEVRWLLERQLTSSVRWVDTIVKMKEKGVRRILEIGPKKVLTGLIKRIDGEIQAFNLDEISGLDKAAERLSAPEPS
ncbi:MAG: ACP S-malonyltransferase [Thermodesulfobacteriota bacterium]